MPFQCTPFFDGSDSWHLNGIEQGRAAKDLPSRGILDKGHWVSKRSIFLDHGYTNLQLGQRRRALQDRALISSCHLFRRVVPNNLALILFFFDFTVLKCGVNFCFFFALASLSYTHIYSDVWSVWLETACYMTSCMEKYLNLAEKTF